jgi:hypothetical protein
MSYGNDVQKAIYDALAGNSGLASVVTGVYDNVPQAIDSGATSAFPYVTIGEDVNTEWDTDDSTGLQASITIHVWSRVKGRKQVKTLQGMIYDILHRAELSITGYRFVTVEWEQDITMLDADGETQHGVSTYRLTMEAQ